MEYTNIASDFICHLLAEATSGNFILRHVVSSIDNETVEKPCL
ncbi:MAG: hypothetical protein OEV42_10315 [Deltaproteobacteria bacterium]|nr:hypothetical protein [Deltaproteobacteria bacterium]